MYHKVYFRIESGYRMGECSQAASAAFHEEINEIFRSAGWEIAEARTSGICPYFINGKTKLYSHSTSLSGAIEDGLIEEVESLLSRGNTFKHYKTDIYDELFDWSDEEYQVWLESMQDEIKADLLKIFTTKRSNLYMQSFGAIEQVKEKYHKARVKSFLGRSSDDIEWRYAERLFKELCSCGKIISAETRQGLCFRTAKPAELRIAV